MMARITDYGVSELAELSGVTVRALHHYDRIGLLRPARTGTGRYRRYGRDELERLQEILIYRASGLPLREIAALMADPSGAARAERLARHLVHLQHRASELAAMIATLRATLAAIAGESTMTDKDLYAPFDAGTQAAYDAWLTDRGGPPMAAALARARGAMAGEGLPTLIAALQAIEARLVQVMQDGPGARGLTPALEAHRALMARFWGAPCTSAAYAGLADIYLTHPDFAAHFEALAPGMAEWLPRAMKAHAADLAQREAPPDAPGQAAG